MFVYFCVSFSVSHASLLFPSQILVSYTHTLHTNGLVGLGRSLQGTKHGVGRRRMNSLHRKRRQRLLHNLDVLESFDGLEGDMGA